MNSRSVRNAPRISHDGNVNIGAISIFALIVILCMAVLSVLAVSTAHSSLVLSQRQAASTEELYKNETAAQVFVAGLDELAQGGGVDQPGLTALCNEAEEAAGGDVEATATLAGDTVRAEFACEGGRTLKIEVAATAGEPIRIDSWRMTAVEVEEQPIGTLYSVENGE